MLARIVAGVAVIAVLMLASSGPGTRLGLWEWQMGFTLLRWALYMGLAVAGVALILLLVPKSRRSGSAWLAAALVLGLAAAAPVLGLRSQAQSLPYIHDITTDSRDPPVFVALMPVRKSVPNGADYGGPEIAAAQAKGYPDVRPLQLALAPPRAFERALEVARTMGWEIAASDANAGRIEATATTSWFGFKDDVIVRVTPEGAGSRVDVRSVSRVGKSDIGANARRVREYLSKLT
jgi:uncharacterized protein (DUF1499 family)